MALNNKSALLGLIERKDFLELGKSLDKNADVPSIEIYMQPCEACEKGTSQVTVRHVSKRPTGSIHFADVSQVVLKPRARALLP